MRHLGGGPLDGTPTIRSFRVDPNGSPSLEAETPAFPARPTSWKMLHDGLYVASGPEVVRHDRSRPDLPATGSWSAGDEILALADGPERGLVLALDRQALSLVRFTDAEPPQTVWSYRIDAGPLAGETGRPLLRSGNYAYVADPGLPGVRVLSIDPEVEPTTVATYVSHEGLVHDLALWGTRLALLTPSTAVLLDVQSIARPAFTRLGSYSTTFGASRIALDSRHAFLADGANLLVLDVDPASPDFMTAPVASWTAPTNVRDIRLDRRGRAYVLLADSWEVLDVSAFR